jgi:hypothetical protein
MRRYSFVSLLALTPLVMACADPLTPTTEPISYASVTVVDPVGPISQTLTTAPFGFYAATYAWSPSANATSYSVTVEYASQLLDDPTLLVSDKRFDDTALDVLIPVDPTGRGTQVTVTVTARLRNSAAATVGTFFLPYPY